MPRAPRFTHPVRAIRSALRLTQPALAKKLGISASYLKAIENGQRPPNDLFRAKLSSLSGVKPETITTKRGIPRDWRTDQPISADSVKEWSSYRQSDVSKSVAI